MKTTLIAGLVGTGMLMSAGQALAWGQEGHRVTGYVAQSLLTTEARKQVAKLIPAADFSDLALYMDVHKSELKVTLPGSDTWHYTDLPVCKDDSEDPCPDGNCATVKIDEYAAVLADKKAPVAARRQALVFLLHMVGDIHQPLHAADHHDRGGNDIKLSGSGANNLHSFWDTAVVRNVLNGEDEQSWASEALSANMRNIATWQKGTAADWVNESNGYARDLTYAKLPGFSCGTEYTKSITLPRSYITASQDLVRSQLVKGGARIAYVINRALDKSVH
ncbi:S1/P1 nuclease [Paludibacterium paludis]|uniref:Endonuclease n=1 Tax=Paludibacterium paludis TaxID=1225769 RepID=A0A918P584_9NEIS|nr:S1/P1 nuclease [Paludibacterium paludis]GGY21113.1 endonuclease [Paludibacterium paludis]